jgi:hypothetical protein
LIWRKQEAGGEEHEAASRAAGELGLSKWVHKHYLTIK